MLAAIAIPLLFVSVAVMAVGLHLIHRAHRQPNFPACRKCEYNLIGLPVTDQPCPECGAPAYRKWIETVPSPWTRPAQTAIGSCLHNGSRAVSPTVRS